ncbi:GNAT family N-acetyltransferase [Candidatus Pelagibacter sp.]|mgnify:FL=1|nr:GNAT family N-acetyltransferase [Candidatus Pelagibacter sp.]
MSKKIERNYLEINSLNDLKETRLTQNGFSFEKVEPENFKINKFFYKNVGKKHHWVDRLVWTDKNWIDYTTDNKVKTFIVKKHDDLVGYFELIHHEEQNEVEIAYLGLLEEYHNKKIGSFLLSTAIKNAFLEKPQRVWVHTCSLDHKNALKNYIARGMKIFKKETVFV